MLRKGRMQRRKTSRIGARSPGMKSGIQTGMRQRAKWMAVLWGSGAIALVVAAVASGGSVLAAQLLGMSWLGLLLLLGIAELLASLDVRGISTEEIAQPLIVQVVAAIGFVIAAAVGIVAAMIVAAVGYRARKLVAIVPLTFTTALVAMSAAGLVAIAALIALLNSHFGPVVSAVTVAIVATGAGTLLAAQRAPKKS